PFPPTPWLRLDEVLRRELAEQRAARAFDAYRLAIKKEYMQVFRWPDPPTDERAAQVWIQPEGTTEWQPLGYTTDVPVVGMDHGVPDPYESAVIAWPQQYGKTHHITAAFDPSSTGAMRRLFEALLTARLDRRLRRLARDLGRREATVRRQFEQVQTVLERTGIGDGFGQLTIAQPVRPPLDPPAVPRLVTVYPYLFDPDRRGRPGVPRPLTLRSLPRTS
ncbi:hypothetical protein PYK79_52905, partial [Streptomyces sp. ID05-04B]|uniref:hypothetical protein n=1 Tax=Streptomyces sp. ID05-04B TaxID=3028661 RepID=UPI0029C4D884